MINKKALKAFIDQKRPEGPRSDMDAKFYPSAADRWLECPASINLSKGIPAESSKYSEEGKLAHRVCEAEWEWRENLTAYDAELNRELMVLPDGGTEMCEHARSWCDMLENIDSNHKVIYKACEKYVNIHANKEKDVRIGGLIDFIFLTDKGPIVLDYKYGQGRNVSADTSQIKTYLSALLDLYEDEDAEFRAVVFQPRTDSLPKEKVYTRKEIKAYRDRMVFQSEQAYKLGPDKAVDGKHCFWCPARRTKDQSKKCPLMKKREDDKLDEAFSTYNDQKTTKYSGPNRDHKTLAFFKIFPELEAIFKDLQEEYLTRLEGGEPIAGMTLKKKYGRRAWKFKDVDEMEEAVKQAFPMVTPSKTVKKMLGVTEIEKKVGKKMFEKAELTKKSEKNVIGVDFGDNNDILTMFDEYDD